MRQKWPQKPPLGTPINWSHPSAKGLVLDLEFQEGGGDFANDLSGNNNHGTLKNMAFPATTASGWNPGKFGACPKFDGTDDYVDCGYNSNFDFKGAGHSFTLAAWINTNQVSSDQGIIGRWAAASYRQYILKIESATNGIKFAIKDNTGYQIAESVANTITIDDWIYVVGVADAGTLSVCINGIQSGTTDTYATIENIGTEKTLIIGANSLGNLGNEERFNGQIDQVRAYNRALPAEEIYDNYINSFGMFERTKWGLLVPFAPPSGLSIPVAMHNYRRLRT